MQTPTWSRGGRAWALAPGLSCCSTDSSLLLSPGECRGLCWIGLAPACLLLTVGTRLAVPSISGTSCPPPARAPPRPVRNSHAPPCHRVSLLTVRTLRYWSFQHVYGPAPSCRPPHTAGVPGKAQVWPPCPSHCCPQDPEEYGKISGYAVSQWMRERERES